MRVLKLAIPGLFALAATAGAAEPLCPWMNAATAAGVLGGPVTPSFTGTQDAGACAFVRRDGSRVSSLHIEVFIMKNPSREFHSIAARCGTKGTALRAIGNEAILCGGEGPPKSFSGQVVGRVRDRAFVIRIDAADTPASSTEWRASLRDAAEQVAGMLF